MYAEALRHLHWLKEAAEGAGVELGAPLRSSLMSVYLNLAAAGLKLDSFRESFPAVHPSPALRLQRPGRAPGDVARDALPA